jgi:NSS family neurotransmitter:Na+ symporter
VLIPVAVLLFVVFVGWVGSDQFTEEVSLGSSLGESVPATWLWWVRLVIPVAVGLTLVLGVQSLLIKAKRLESAVILA